MLLVVVFRATLTYITVPWFFQDRSTSVVFDYVAVSLYPWVMNGFFGARHIALPFAVVHSSGVTRRPLETGTPACSLATTARPCHSPTFWARPSRRCPGTSTGASPDLLAWPASA